jgi:hypothetical protein
LGVTNFIDWLTDAVPFAASLATAFGLPLGVVAAYVATRSYVRTTRNADDAHMHGLFRDYLLRRLDFVGPRADDIDLANLPAADRDMMVFRLYVLEEMFGWLGRQWVNQRRPSRFHGRKSREAYARRLDYLLGWRKTIQHHLTVDQPNATSQNLIKHGKYYSTDFLLFAAEGLKSDALYTLAANRTPEWRPLVSRRRGKRFMEPPFEAPTT